MCSAPSMRPWCHSMGSRTSRTVTPSGIGSGTWATSIVGTSIMASRLLQQPRHAPVGQRFAAGLTGGAVLQARVGEADLTHRVAADRAELPRTAVHRHVALLLTLELAGCEAGRALHGIAEHGSDGVVEGLQLALAETAGGFER